MTQNYLNDMIKTFLKNNIAKKKALQNEHE